MTKNLINKIKNKTAKVGIIGLGYVGLELAINIASKKYSTYGFDTNEKKINLIRKGISPLNTISNNKIKFLNTKNINHIRKIHLINNCDIIIICLPTPVKKNLEPDNSFLINCIKMIKKYLKEDQMIILESTVYPFATRDIFEKNLDKFNIGSNFNLCFSPERVSPGQHDLTKYSNITKLVSGYTKNCLKNISTFYKKIFLEIYQCNSLELAEFTKLYENSYRAVNIGLANQMKKICDKLNINIFDVVKAASTKPFGFTPFLPGPGVGGHCIPIDPLFISYVAKKNKISADFILLARKENLMITKWIANKIKKHLYYKAKILILGLSYKKNIDDTRESPSIKLMEILSKKFILKFHDPFIKKISLKNKEIKSLKKISYKDLKNYDGVVIATDHDDLDYSKILKYSNLIFDTRGVYQNTINKKIIFC